VKKVLLTSSSSAFLKRNVTLVTGKGFQLFTAANGSEAVKLHQKHLFDLILSDLELADMDGGTLCAEVHHAEPSAAVRVVLICLNTSESLDKVKQSNADAILLRPIDPSQLLVTIGSFIDMQLARSTRVEFIAAVSGRKQGKEFSCISHDISSTGILIGTDVQLAAGELINFDFKLFDATQIQTDVEVARCISAPDGNMLYGVKFIDLPEAKRDAIKKYIALNTHLGVMEQPLLPLPLK